MPYKCVNCSKLYEKDAAELREGCSCNSRFFFFISDEKLGQITQKEEKEIALSNEEKEKVEKEVREMTDSEDEKTPLYLDFESVKILKSGRYAVDIEKMFSKKDPRIYKLEDGKYIVDLANLAKKRAN